MRPWAWIGAGLLSAVAALGIGQPISTVPSLRPIRVQVGRLAPRLAAHTMSGGRFHLATVHRPVMLTFWASWCTFCRADMPNVVRLASQAHGRYRVVTVNVTHIDQLQGARQFARQFHLPQPVLLDPTGRIQQAYLVSVLPTTYYLNAKGVVVAQVLGAETFGAMSRHLAQAGVRP